MTHEGEPAFPDRSPAASRLNPSPDAALEAAHKNQDRYEELSRAFTAPANKQSMYLRHHHGAMAENNALLAIAGYLREIRDMLTPDSFGDDPVPEAEATDLPMVGQPTIFWDTRLSTRPPLLGVGQKVWVKSKDRPEIGVIEYEVTHVGHNRIATLQRIYKDG